MGFEDRPLSMQELFDNFEADCKRRKLHGVDIIGYHLKLVRAWFEAMRVDQVTELELERYVNHRLGQARKESTVNREMQYLVQHVDQANDQWNVVDSFVSENACLGHGAQPTAAFAIGPTNSRESRDSSPREAHRPGPSHC